MSHTREALDTLGAAVDLLRRGFSLPAEPASARALRVLAAQDAPPAKPPEAALAKLRRDLVALSNEGRGFAIVPAREMRHAPWLLWAPSEPLAALPGLLDDLIARARERRSLLRALIEAWIAGYVEGAAMIREAAAALRRLIGGHPHPSFQAWAKIDDDVRLFDTDGPRVFARRLMQSTEPVDAVLARAGFDDPLRAVSGYMRAVQREVLALAPDRVAVGSGARDIERIFVFLAPRGALRFPEPEATGGTVRALLAPWLRGGRGAGEDVRLAVQEFLLEHLGDPRLRPQLWKAAGEDAVALVWAWLTKASLDAFFRLIRDHALDSQWIYREAFWGAYLKAGAITDARLAFAPSVYDDARTVKELRGAFGKLEGNGVQQNHSVLLMRVGDLVFCEWSHNGALRAWPNDWKTAPRLTGAIYDRRNLMAACLPFPPNERGKGGNADGTGLHHRSANTGHWQGSVAELIARRARVRLTPRDYMPK